MAEDISSPLLALIREQGLIDDLQYEEVVAELKRSNAPVIQLLQDFGIMKLDDILHVHCRPHRRRRGVVEGPRISAGSCCRQSPPRSRRCIIACPSRMNNGTVQVALADPLDPAHADEIHFAIKRDVQIVVADPAEINKAIDRLYGQDETGAGFAEILKELGADSDIAREVDEAAEDVKRLEDLANEAPIVKFVSLVLQQAIQDRASDIHFEPFETEFHIRYRVDGALYEMAPPPKHLALPVISRLKVMANLNISERRLPQDGRISLNILQPPGGPAHVHPAHAVRRVRRVARAGPFGGQSGSRIARLPQIHL